MADKKPNKVMVPQGGVLRNLLLQFKLVLRLLGDRRISLLLKIIPIGALIYLISPIDFLMGVPGVDALDDAAVIWIGSTLFLELCPQNVVEEHRQALISNFNEGASEEVIDAESTDVND
jgi:uncharacterized membrane protein YkvA (DUF1232 family)